MESGKILHPKGNITSEDISKVGKIKTPAYLYDDTLILKRCEKILDIPNIKSTAQKNNMYRFAMKANSNGHIVDLITKKGIGIDASSLNEAKRANMSGVPLQNILLTSQEIYQREKKKELEEMMLKGLQYNVCSMKQLKEIAEFSSRNKIPLSIRVHPLGDVGSGESITRNTASKYSCFGIHVNDLEQVLNFAKEKGLSFIRVHDHIGSGGDPEKWKENIEVLLSIIEKYFSGHPVSIVNFGGGIKEARMPEDKSADVKELGDLAYKKVQEFNNRTRRELSIEVEPGTYLVANSGYIITKVIDKKSTGKDGFNFLILDGGMELNSRQLLYGSKHPFYIISQEGKILYSDFQEEIPETKFVPVGRCCESGDSQSLDEKGNIIPRKMAEPKIGDYLVIGGCGAYGSTMSPFNYNSHTQAPEFSKLEDGNIAITRKPQSLKQITQNETFEIIN